MHHRNSWRFLLTVLPFFCLGLAQAWPTAWISQIPAQVVPQYVVLICVSAFVICSLAALVPAYFAARLDPVKALRQE